MSALRRMLPSFAFVWLLCQAGAATLAPTMLVMSAGADAECTCGHGAHAMCPMHHRSTGTTRCSMRSTGDPATATLTVLLGGIGVMPTRATFDQPLVAASPISRGDASSLRRSTPPDSPPPRT